MRGEESFWNSYWIGIVAGLLMPAAFGWVYLWRFGLLVSLGNSLAMDYMGPQLLAMLGRVLLVAVFPNLAFVFVTYKLDWWKTAKGLMVGAMPYLIGSIFLVA